MCAKIGSTCSVENVNTLSFKGKKRIAELVSRLLFQQAAVDFARI